MKKLIKFILPVVVAFTLTTTGFIVFQDNTEYYVNANNFQSTIEYKSEVDLTGLVIVETEKEEIVAEHQVDSSMVVSCDSTNSIGEKTLVLQYEKEQFVVNFIVKYKVQFEVEGNIVASQFVNKASEITVPADPYLKGYEFTGWNPLVPEVINDNVTFKATFTDEPAIVPNLGSYEAVYGDTLETIELPSNTYGKWQFVDPLTTTVGNAGINKFDVEFIPTNPELKVLTGSVNVEVAKKVLEFKNVVTTFDYDGKEHLPSYELDVEGINVTVIGAAGVEVGSYFVVYSINDANYEGSWQGSFSIVATEITIKFEQEVYEINLGDTLPEFKYIVTGIEDPSLLDLKVIHENINHAGEYEIDIKVGNASYKNVKITKSKLIVNKISLGTGLPTYTVKPVYGNKLSSIVLEGNNPNGFWAWENPEYSFDYAGEHLVNLVFTPYSSLDYEVEVVEVKLNAFKRTLTFGDILNVFTYALDKDGNPIERTIGYTLYDGENVFESTVEVTGNIVKTNAGSYDIKLVVEDDNYDGSYDATLKINKATPETNFNVVFDDIVIGTTLNDIEGMPEGYTWTLSEELKEAGQFEYDVIFTPEDTENYSIVNGKFTVNVIKKTPSIIANESYKFTYDGTVHELTGIYGSYDKAVIKFYNIDITNPDNVNFAPEEVVLMNAGTYTVYVTLLENNEYYALVKAVTVEIDGSTVKEPVEYTAIYGDLLNSIKLPEVKDENGELIGKWVWENADDTTTVGDAGIQFYTSVFESVNPNYQNDPVEVKVTVAKKSVKIEVINNVYDYDGLEHTIEYKIYKDNEEITLNVEGNLVKVNQGINATTLTIDEKNYTGSVATQLVINAIDPEVEWPTLKANVFTSLYDLSNELVEGMIFTSKNEKFTNVGEYEYDAVYVMPNDPNNNYNKLNGKVKVIVSSVNGEITGVEENYEFVYGEEVVINANPSHEESELVYTCTLAGKEVEEIKNVGEYELTITLPATANYNEVSVTTTITIIEKEVEVVWTYADDYVYTGEELALPTAYFKDVNNEYVYLTVTELEEKEFINAGSYQFEAYFDLEFVDAANYKLVKETSEIVEVAKQKIDVSEYKWTYTNPFKYDETEHEVTLLTFAESITPVYEENAKTDAGTYTATVTFEYDEENIEIVGEVTSCEWTIDTAFVVVEWEYETTYTFTGEQLDLPVATINKGLIELTVTENDGKTFRNVGTYTFTASTDNANYELSGITTDIIEVKQATLEVVWDVPTYIYTGEELTAPIAWVDVLEGRVELVTSTEDSFVNVGKYTFTAKFNDTYDDRDNYVLENEKIEVEIKQADFDLSAVYWDYSEALVYTGSEIEVKLVNVPECLTPIYENNKFTNAGKYTATVTFEYDEDNYNIPEVDELVWEIKTKEVSVVWTYEEEYVYTGNDFATPKAKFINVNNEDVALIVTEANGKTFNEKDNYTFVATIANQTDAKNYTLINDELELSITMAKVKIDSLTATYGDTLNDVELPSSEFGAWEFVMPSTTSVGNAGENSFAVKFISTNDNYESYETTVKIVVSKKVVTIDVLESEFVYDKAEKTILAQVLDGTNVLDITILGNVKATNASTTETTLYISEDNYEAIGVSVSLFIDKAEANITSTLPSQNTKDYDGNTVRLEGCFTLNHDETELDVTVTLARTLQVIKDAGTYTIVVSAEETTNYYAADNVTISYTINKISPELTYTAPADGYTYDSNVLSVESYVSHINTDEEIEINYTYVLDDQTVNAIRDAGTYSVTATIAETTNYNLETITFTVVVEKGEFNVTDLATIKAIYNQQLKDFPFATVEGGTWAWENPEEYVGNVGERTHKAIFTPTDESYASEERDVKFIVSPRTITITIVKSTFTYDGSSKTVIYGLSETPSGVTVKVTEGQITATNYKESGYTFTLEITGNDNYTGSVNGTLVINKGDLSLTAPTLNVTYLEGMKYSDITLPTHADGKWVWNDANALVGNAGKKSPQVTFKPTNTNYNEAKLTATVNVAKANYTPSIIPSITQTVTYGDLISSFGLPTDSNGTWKWSNTNYVSNAGEYTFTAIFTHTYNNNYNDYTTTITVDVAKKVLTFTDIKNTFDYNTSNQVIGYKLNGLVGNDTVTVSGNTGLTNAGSATFILEVIDDNYTANSGEIVLTINPIVPETDFSTVYTYTYGETLSNEDLPAGYTWAQELELTKVGDGQQFAAKYTPTSSNYVSVEDYFTVNVIRITGSITVTDNQQFTYGDEIALGAVTNNTDNEENAKISTVVYVKGTTTVTTLENAGEYTVVFSTGETAHYTAATETINVVIEKKEEEIDVVTEYEYGSSIEDVKHTTVTEVGTVEYSLTNPNTRNALRSNGSSNFLGLAGYTKTIYMIFTPFEEFANNYKSYVKEIIVSIVKKELTINVTNSKFTYDGNLHSIEFTLEGIVDGEEVVVENSNFAIRNVKDSQQVTLTIVSDNYRGSKTVDLTIEKANPSTIFNTNDAKFEADWNTRLSQHTAIAELLANGYSLTDQVLEDIKEYKINVRYTPTDTDNYNVVDGIFTVNVNRLENEIKIDTTKFANLVYNPNTTYSINPQVIGEGTAVITVNGLTEYTIIKNAGTYSVVITVAQTAHYNATSLEFEFTIAKANPSISFNESLTGVYGQTLNDVKLPTVANGTFAWVDKTTTLTVGSLKCAVKYTPTDKDNYNIIDGEFTVVVVKATPSLTANNNYQFTYDGNIHTLTGITVTGRQYTSADLKLYNINVLDAANNGVTPAEVVLLNAGTYTLYITLLGNGNYNTVVKQVTVKIDQAELAAPTGLTVVYNENITLASVQLPTSTYGTWAFENPTLGLTAGAHTVRVVFTSTNNNYKTFTTSVDVLVTRKETVITPTDAITVGSGNVINVDYNGSKYDPKTWFTANHFETSIAFSVSGDGTELLNTGTYTLTITMEATNYTAVNLTYTVNIAQAEYDVTSLPTVEGNVIYGETLNKVTLTGGEEAGKWSWYEGTKAILNIGEVTYFAVFTPNDYNYKCSTKFEVKFTVVKKELTINILNNEFTYDGNAHGLSIAVNGIIGTDGKELTGENVVDENGILWIGNVNTGVKIEGYKRITDVLESQSSTPVELTIVSDFYAGSSTPTKIVINPATPTITYLPTYDDEYYENEISDVDLVNGATASIDGTFSYNKNDVAYENMKDGCVSVTITFTPTDSSNYNNQYGTIRVILKPMAHIGSTYFGTIEKALDSANDGDSVWVIAGINVMIKEDTAIKTGVKLYIPYKDDTESSSEATLSGEYYNYLEQAKLQTTVTLKAGKTLEIKTGGTLEIGAVLSAGQANAGGYCGHTGGEYAQLVLESNSEILSNGTIYSYGYIAESFIGNNSKVTLESGALYAPFIVRDFRGGSFTYAVNNAKDDAQTFPFNQLEIINIEPLQIIKYNAVIHGMANITASNKIYPADVKYIGNTSDYFIQLAQESYAELKYNKDEDVQHLDVFGGGQTNPLVLDVIVSVSSTNFYFPISMKFNMGIYKKADQTSANFVMNQKYKLLPGSVFTVGTGVNLTLNEMIVYDNWVDTLTVGGIPYANGEKLPGGKFIVNGNVTVKNFAGRVYTEGSGATFKVTGKTSLTGWEPLTTNGNLSFATSVTSWDYVQCTLNMYMITTEGVSDYTSYCSAGTYYSRDGGWYTTSGTIYYDGNGGLYTGLEEREEPFSIDENGYVIINSDIPSISPTREHYRFEGWCYDAAGTKPVKVGDVIFASTTLFAKWTPITYYINYVDKFYSSDDSGQSITNSETSFNIETYIPLGIPENGLLVFIGYFYNESLKEDYALPMLDGATLVNYLSPEDSEGNRYVNIYLSWYPEETVPYKIYYINDMNDISDVNKNAQCEKEKTFVIVSPEDWSKISLPNIGLLNTDTTFNMYFEGWFLDQEFTKPVTSISDAIFEGESTQCTLYAKWTEKYLINININTYTNADYKTETIKYYYLKNNSLTFSKADYLPSGYAYKAILNGSTDVTLGTEFSTNGFENEVTLVIELHKIITVSLTVTGGSDYKNPKLILSGYVDTSGKIINSSVTYTSTTSSINVIYGITYTLSADGKSIKAFNMYIGDTHIDSGGFWSSKSSSGTIQNNLSFRITD